MTDSRPILIFDSGMGGLTVARAVAAHMPGAVLDYAADTAAFPIGGWAERALDDRICTVVGALIERNRPRAVVIACNTASTVALTSLRARFDIPFVGTVPAIKPAALGTKSGVIGVLATEGTIARDYTRALIETFAFQHDVVLHGCPELAGLAERKLRGEPVPDEAIRAEIEPVFVERSGKRTDAVVLGCTHYPLLLEEVERVAPWPVTFVDPSDAIARRVKDVLPGTGPAGQGRAWVTSKDGLSHGAVFEKFGFSETLLIDLPVHDV